ncbi:hypothetical protein KP509_27G025400 [Ceratopteris richardii]|uniref:Serine aminopeptidase S33 domain-containing protein n=1 Tax=Ceratopteris richardii TaxID=49495 RepID=A0A8T2RH96_CERRI|nr:hypothetical protein KP509_27G025400 [Ceratopteris richardii]
MSTSSSVRYSENFVYNSRGSKLFTCSWLPASDKIKALVFLCHGYAAGTIFMKGTAERLARAGFAVFGLDYEGHGKSDGPKAYIKSFSNVVDDCVDYFKTIREREEYRDKARFLLGESMGGAVALRVHRKESNDWNGAVLVAPMVKIADELKPPTIVISILEKLCILFPTWKIVPIRDIIDTGLKDPLKREEMGSSPYAYHDKPRLRTAFELLNASLDLEQKLKEVYFLPCPSIYCVCFSSPLRTSPNANGFFKAAPVTLPFIVVHGEADVVTDIAVSRSLYETASSLDKTLKTYPDMWHSLLFGEPEKNIDLVMSDIVTWLDERTPGTGSDASSPTLLAHSQSHTSHP